MSRNAGPQRQGRFTQTLTHILRQLHGLTPHTPEPGRQASPRTCWRSATFAPRAAPPISSWIISPLGMHRLGGARGDDLVHLAFAWQHAARCWCGLSGNNNGDYGGGEAPAGVLYHRRSEQRRRASAPAERGDACRPSLLSPRPCLWPRCEISLDNTTGPRHARPLHGAPCIAMLLRPAASVTLLARRFAHACVCWHACAAQWQRSRQP